jgi:hypothetical protein
MARNEHGPLGKAWIDICSDVNWSEHGGCWARLIEGTRYHVIRFENCEEWGDGATGYHCDLSEVDTSNPQLASAQRSCGYDGTVNESLPLCQVYCLHAYGAHAPLWQQAGTNARELIRAAKRESRLLQRDSAEYEDRMDRPVNAIGTSARNYGLGKILSSD